MNSPKKVAASATGSALGWVGLVLPLAVLLLSVIIYGRLLTLVIPFPANLPVAVIVACLLCGFIAEGWQRRLNAHLIRLYVPLTGLTILSIYWVYAFWAQSGGELDLRAAAAFHGLYVALAVSCLLKFSSVRFTLSMLFWFSFAYILLYILTAQLLASQSLTFRPETSAVLKGGGRGERLYLASSLLAFAYFYALSWVLRNKRGRSLALLFCLVCIYATYLSQSRFATAALILVTILRFTPIAAVRFIISAVPIIFISLIAVWLWDARSISDLLSSDASLDLRAAGFIYGHGLFVDQFMLGIGSPADITLLWQKAQFQFFPQDLGPAGVAISYGIVGVAIYLFLMFRVSKFVWLRPESAIGIEALWGATLYTIVYSLISPTLLLSDGALIVAFIAGLVLPHQRKRVLRVRIKRPAGEAELVHPAIRPFPPKNGAADLVH